jgi:hypothetical protein
MEEIEQTQPEPTQPEPTQPEPTQPEQAQMEMDSTETASSSALLPAAEEAKMAGDVPVCAAAVPFALTEVSGSPDMTFSVRLGEQVMGCLDLRPFGQDERNHRTEAAMGAMREIGARDGLEGMIAAQMVAAQSAGMNFLSRAMLANKAEHGRRYGRMATDLMELFLRQTEALQRLRGRERRSVQVRHERIDQEGRISVSAEHEQIK